MPSCHCEESDDEAISTRIETDSAVLVSPRLDHSHRASRNARCDNAGEWHLLCALVSNLRLETGSAIHAMNAHAGCANEFTADANTSNPASGCAA